MIWLWTLFNILYKEMVPKDGIIRLERNRNNNFCYRLGAFGYPYLGIRFTHQPH